MHRYFFELEPGLKIRLSIKLISLVLAAAAIAMTLVTGCGDSPPAEVPSTPSKADVLPPTVTPTPPASELAPIGQPEPFAIDDLELIGLDGWINSSPLSVDDLIGSGQVVLLDFWTYTCINCVRTFPYLSAWYETYAEHGLTVIGVHSPEFEFEKLPLNVQRSVERYDLTYPVALDGNKETWDRYGNHFWPSKYLIGASGEVVFRHFSSVTEPRRSDAAHTITRELYGGYKNNYLADGLYAGQDVYYEAPDVEVEYSDDGTRRRGQFYLDGVWMNLVNAVVTANRSEADSTYFAFDFFATSVNAVLGNSEPTPAGAGEDGHLVVVELDGRPLSQDEAGADIKWDSAGDKFRRSCRLHDHLRNFRIRSVNSVAGRRRDCLLLRLEGRSDVRVGHLALVFVQQACGQLMLANQVLCRTYGVTTVHHRRAPVGKLATGDLGVGYLPVLLRRLRTPSVLRVGLGNRLDKQLRVRVLRALNHRIDCARLDNRSTVHHKDVVADLVRSREIVGDIHDRNAQVAVQAANRVKNGRSKRRIHHRYRLVSEDNPRL